MTNTIRAERATIEFCDGLSVDGYRMPDGEFRVGIASAIKLLGFGESWLEQEPSPRLTIERLRREGFTREVRKDLVQLAESSEAIQTVSLFDFIELMRLAKRKGFPEAELLADFLADAGLVRIEGGNLEEFKKSYTRPPRVPANRVRETRPQAFLYVLVDEGNRIAKVGFSRNVKKRVENHRTSHPLAFLAFVAKVESMDEEALVHKALEAFLVPGCTEWFNYSEEFFKVLFSVGPKFKKLR